MAKLGGPLGATICPRMHCQTNHGPSYYPSAPSIWDTSAVDIMGFVHYTSEPHYLARRFLELAFPP